MKGGKRGPMASEICILITDQNDGKGEGGGSKFLSFQ